MSERRVRRPLRVDVLPAREGANGFRLSAGRIDQREPVGTDLEHVEARREPIGREGDAAAVGRPRRLQIGVRIVGQLARLPGAEIEHPQVGEPAAHPGECDRVAVGRPRRIEDLVDLRKRVLAFLVARSRVEDGERRAAVGDRGDGDALAGRVPPAR